MSLKFINFTYILIVLIWVELTLEPHFAPAPLRAFLWGFRDHAIADQAVVDISYLNAPAKLDLRQNAAVTIFPFDGRRHDLVGDDLIGLELLVHVIIAELLVLYVVVRSCRYVNLRVHIARGIVIALGVNFCLRHIYQFQIKLFKVTEEFN